MPEDSQPTLSKLQSTSSDATGAALKQRLETLRDSASSLVPKRVGLRLRRGKAEKRNNEAGSIRVKESEDPAARTTMCFLPMSDRVCEANGKKLTPMAFECQKNEATRLSIRRRHNV